MRDVLVLCPHERDVAAIRAAGLDRAYRVHFAGADLDTVTDFDPEAMLDEWSRLPADGVVGTKDRSALLASLVAERRGLPGPRPNALLACQLKPRSREIQRRVCPEATPAFALLDGRAPDFAPPWFVKPVVGRLSQEVRRVESARDLIALVEAEGYREGYARIAALAGVAEQAVHGFLAERLVVGDEVTLEGFALHGRVTTIGVTDSVKYRGTNSFERFEYPSALPQERQRELREVAEALVPALGFDDGFFNIEFIIAPGEPAQIVEVNARIASQFAPLVEAVEGRSTYSALLQLACGEDPGWAPVTPRGVAVSYVLRVFGDAFVASAPEPAEGLEVLVRPGLRLSEQGLNDMASYRLAILYAAGETRERAIESACARAAELGFDLRPDG
jgi:ATP-grasp domain